MLAAAEREKARPKDCAMACEAKLVRREQQVITIAWYLEYKTRDTYTPL